MPRKSPRPKKEEEENFAIYVSPSCLSAPATPMENESSDIHIPQIDSAAERDIPADRPAGQKAKECDEITPTTTNTWKDIHLGSSRAGQSRPGSAMDGMGIDEVEDRIDGLLEEIRDHGDDDRGGEQDGDETGVEEKEGEGEEVHEVYDMHEDERTEHEHSTLSEDDAHESSYISHDAEEIDASELRDDSHLDADTQTHGHAMTVEEQPDEGEPEEHTYDDAAQDDEGHEEGGHEDTSLHATDSHLDEETQPAVEYDNEHGYDHELEHEDSLHDEGSILDESLVHRTSLDQGLEQEDDHRDEPSVHDTSFQGDTSVYDDERSVLEEPDNDYLISESSPEHHEVDGQTEDDPISRRTSAISDCSLDRRGSLRTEALIQAAARVVVAQIEERAIAAVQSHRDSLSPRQAEDVERSLQDTKAHDEHDGNDTPEEASLTNHPSSEHTSPTSRRHSETLSKRDSTSSNGSQIHHHQSSSSDSGSHHDPSASSDSDIFSDHSHQHSARSSLGSIASNSDPTPVPKSQAKPTKTKSQTSTPRRSRESAVSAISAISSISQYDVAPPSPFSTTTPTSRIPFRTTSSVRALQLSSPTPSVFAGSSPRSSKRHPSRLDNPSPTPSAQYHTPKHRPTPPRFKIKKEDPPLVLLHVTLLPLRWVWGEVVDGLDSVSSKLDVEGAGFKPTEALTSLRDAWRVLQDRVGDTVLERGILLPHPQNDYEVLEERLLEALELPLRRRARILECGHYLGPSNSLPEEGDGLSESEQETDSEAEGGKYDLRASRFQKREKRHWCTTCRNEIRYESLGEGKVFRVKVYASNGLMKAGAWAACWKEMERVDVEVEPIVGVALHRELEKLAVYQLEEEDRRRREVEEEEQRRRDEEMKVDAGIEEEVHLPTPSYDHHHDSHADNLSSPLHAAEIHASPPSPIATSPTILITRSPSPTLREMDISSARRRRDEARLREIYGMSPPPAPEFINLDDATAAIPSSVQAEPPTSTLPREAHDPETDAAHTTSSYSGPPYPTPRSPSEEAYERRTHRRGTTGPNSSFTQPYAGASLPELMVEAVKVLMRDRKNVVIFVLGVFVLLLALGRNAGRETVVDVAGYGVAPLQPVLTGDIQVDGFGRETGMDGLESVVVGGMAGTGVEMAHTTVSHTLENEAVVSSAATASTSIAVTDQTPEVETHADVDLPSSAEASSVSVTVAVSPPEETVTEKKVVRVVETVTETVKVSVTATESVVVPIETEKTHVAEKEEKPIATELAQYDLLKEVRLEMCLVETDVCVIDRMF